MELIMKLPKQSKPVERKTYNANAVAVGANTSAGMSRMIQSVLFPSLAL